MSDSNILTGVDKVINKALGLEKESLKYDHKERCQLFSKGTRPEFDGKALIQNILDQIKSNWHKGKSRSKENWRWEKNPELKTKSEEAILERWIVRTATGCNWVNQVPVASGLTPSRSSGGRRAIDLVHWCGGEWYEFIELKVDERAGTPLFAAMEILQYGVLYIFSRENSKDLGYDETEKELLKATKRELLKAKKKELLKAEGIHLKVLAPAIYYKEYDLWWLEEGINSGLAKFLGERGFKMDFKFEFLSRSPVTWKGQV